MSEPIPNDVIAVTGLDLGTLWLRVLHTHHCTIIAGCMLHGADPRNTQQHQRLYVFAKFGCFLFASSLIPSDLFPDYTLNTPDWILNFAWTTPVSYIGRTPLPHGRPSKKRRFYSLHSICQNGPDGMLLCLPSRKEWNDRWVAVWKHMLLSETKVKVNGRIYVCFCPLDLYVFCLPSDLLSRSSAVAIDQAQWPSHCSTFKVRHAQVYQGLIWQYYLASFDYFRTKLNIISWFWCIDSDFVDLVAQTLADMLINVVSTRIPNKMVTMRPWDKSL